jgi:hypothetical protein
MSSNTRLATCSSLPGISSINTAVVSANIPQLAKAVIYAQVQPYSHKNFTFVSLQIDPPHILVALTEFPSIK